MDDGDEEGRPDDLLADGVIEFDEASGCWVAAVDWDTVRHASDDNRAAVS
ncbi:MAG: hypothetical protein KY476_16960 [Planctomycetes bacterium]|nr:hypothetical protein [Planctomycetota bacterium]